MFNGKIIYLHGFASQGKSTKSDALIAAYGSNSVVAPDLPIDPNKVIELVDKIIKENKKYPLIFIGTSLGGFWANYFAQRWDASCILVNPATCPSTYLLDKINVFVKNYKTGEAISILPEYITKYKDCEEYIKHNSNGALIRLYLSKDDTVINYAETLSEIPYYISCIIKHDGGHRFEKHWSEIVDSIPNIT